MSTETTTYDAMTEAAEADDLRAILEEVERQNPAGVAVVSTTDDRRLAVEGMTAAEVRDALLADIARIDAVAQGV